MGIDYGNWKYPLIAMYYIAKPFVHTYYGVRKVVKVIKKKVKRSK